MGPSSGRGGRGGVAAWRGGRGVPFKPGPKLGRAVDDELAARDEDDDADDRRSGWDEMGERADAKSRCWTVRRCASGPRTRRRSGEGDEASEEGTRRWERRRRRRRRSGKRGGSKKRRGGAADEAVTTRHHESSRAPGPRRRRRGLLHLRRDDGDDDDEDDDACEGRREKKDPDQARGATAEQAQQCAPRQRGRKRDEAEQRRS